MTIPKSDHTTAACFCLSSFFCLNIRFLPLLLSRNLILSARLKMVNFPRFNSNINSIHKKYSGPSCTSVFLHMRHDPPSCHSEAYRVLTLLTSLPLHTIMSIYHIHWIRNAWRSQTLFHSLSLNPQGQLSLLAHGKMVNCKWICEWVNIDLLRYLECLFSDRSKCFTCF